MAYAGWPLLGNDFFQHAAPLHRHRYGSAHVETLSKPDITQSKQGCEQMSSTSAIPARRQDAVPAGRRSQRRQSSAIPSQLTHEKHNSGVDWLLNELRRLGLSANIARPECLHLVVRYAP